MPASATECCTRIGFWPRFRIRIPSPNELLTANGLPNGTSSLICTSANAVEIPSAAKAYEMKKPDATASAPKPRGNRVRESWLPLLQNLQGHRMGRVQFQNFTPKPLFFVEMTGQMLPSREIRPGINKDQDLKAIACSKERRASSRKSSRCPSWTIHIAATPRLFQASGLAGMNGVVACTAPAQGLDQDSVYGFLRHGRLVARPAHERCWSVLIDRLPPGHSTRRPARTAPKHPQNGPRRPRPDRLYRRGQLGPATTPPTTRPGRRSEEPRDPRRIKGCDGVSSRDSGACSDPAAIHQQNAGENCGPGRGRDG